MTKARTLFFDTAVRLSVAMASFSVLAFFLVWQFIAQPLTHRAAEDLAALMVLTAQVWVELPPGTRTDFQREMEQKHALLIREPHRQLPSHPSTHIYLTAIEQALAKRLGREPLILFDEKYPEFGWVDIVMGDKTLRIGYSESRLISHLPITFLLLVLAGVLIALLVALLLARSITNPLSALAKAVSRFGKGPSTEVLPVAGSVEMAALTDSFNQMQRQIELLIENRTTLLAGISHDLRTPISRMQLSLALMEEQIDPERYQDLQQDLDDMTQIISTTLEFVRGVSQGDKVTVELGQLLQQVVEPYMARGVSVQLRCEAISLQAMESALKRVLGNLLDNAMRYGGGGLIEVSAFRENSLVIIEVRDHGPGIPLAHRERVMQPFARLEASRNAALGGSGLGLAIVAQLCESNGWSLQLDDAPGGGLRVQLVIPD